MTFPVNNCHQGTPRVHQADLEHLKGDWQGNSSTPTINFQGARMLVLGNVPPQIHQFPMDMWYPFLTMHLHRFLNMSNWGWNRKVHGWIGVLKRVFFFNSKAISMWNFTEVSGVVISRNHRKFICFQLMGNMTSCLFLLALSTMSHHEPLSVHIIYNINTHTSGSQV